MPCGATNLALILVCVEIWRPEGTSITAKRFNFLVQRRREDDRMQGPSFSALIVKISRVFGEPSS